jgi:hypothetical protein
MAEITAADLALIQQFRAFLDRLIASTVEAPPQPAAPKAQRPMAWGAKVSDTFRSRVWWICHGDENFPGLFAYDDSHDDLMSCMAWESGRSFSSTVRNMAGSGAVGLIQFMPTTAKNLGTTTAALAAMSPEDQLNFVYKYLRPWAGKVHSLSDMYMTILWPNAVGKPDDFALFTGGIAYRENSGLDTNKDGRVTKAEAAAKLYAMKAEGLRFAA